MVRVLDVTVWHFDSHFHRPVLGFVQPRPTSSEMALVYSEMATHQPLNTEHLDDPSFAYGVYTTSNRYVYVCALFRQILETDVNTNLKLRKPISSRTFRLCVQRVAYR